ncbi:MAG TPA: glucose-6-phosphate isomerase [Chitinophagaceae bacterium]|nr:glucose-6-phosphate isomerase [Chitinophagaceae bacterium]
MLPKVNPTTTRAWGELHSHFAELRSSHLRDLFRGDPGRFERFSIRFEDLLFDYSKNIITDKTLRLLFQLAEDCRLREAIDAMFHGEPINVTEKRAVLHTALRNLSGEPVYCGGTDVMPLVRGVMEKIQRFCDAVHEGRHRGFTGKRIRNIVNIGIGGSDLGPHMVTEALTPFRKKKMKVYFVSNVDGNHIAGTLRGLDPERTLFIISSKTFTTQETMANAQTAREWFLRKARHEMYIRNHFVAVSTNRQATARFGIDEENVFEFWDWVGGRFSLWSAIGLSIALATGYEHFQSLLRGAHSVDRHFYHEAPQQNIPVIMALVGIWYRNFFGSQSEAVLPYDQYLHLFPSYLQQANMESNGKSVDRNGEVVDYSTGPVIWGSPGTNGQHAFFQLLHQGTPLIPCDFIAAAVPHHDLAEHHRLLLSNYFAQTEALMRGKTEEEAEGELKAKNLSAEEMSMLLPFRIFSGNRPSNSFLIRQITPYTLGQLIALYEHKIFVQGVIWNIHSFDQWGVELGKQLSGTLLEEMSKNIPGSHDSSTLGLLDAWKKMSS